MRRPTDLRRPPARSLNVSIEDRALARRLVSEVDIEPGALFVGSAELALIVARARHCGDRIGIGRVAQRRHCRVCGCTEVAACLTKVHGRWTPCAWAEPNLCDACAPHLEAARQEPINPAGDAA